MWPFESNDTETEENRIAENSNDESEETVEIDVEKTKEYTEHTGVATFIDGLKREFTFDAMNDDGNKVVLKNYTGVRKVLIGVNLVPELYGEAFVTIPHNNLKTFETTERESKEMKYTDTKEVPKSEVDE